MGQQPPEQPEQSLPEGVHFRMNWRIADDHPIDYANEFMVQIVRDEIIVTLGQLAPPAVIQPTKEELEELPEKLSPRIVARVAVTPGSLKRLVNLLERQLSLYESEGFHGISEIPSDAPGDNEEANHA